MDSESWKNLLMQNIAPLILGALGLILVIFGLFQFVSRKQPQSSLTFQEAKQEQPKQAELAVDIEGAVINPGVYKLTEGARIVDALASAGGLSEDADREWVEKNINLAKKVTDGLKLYIPRMGEEVLSDSSSDSGTSGPVLNINTASSGDLENLSGIGPVTATKIIEGRPYSDVQELLNRKIVGNATFEKIKDKISAN